MALQLETAGIEPGITVVRVSGRLTFEETGALPFLVRVLLDVGEKKLILDLSGVERIDSLGGTSLIRCFFAAKEAGADLCVSGAPSAAMELFKTGHVDALISFLPNIAAACEHLSAKPPMKANNA